MAVTNLGSRLTHLILVYFLVLSPTAVRAFNVTAVLSSFPELSAFTSLLFLSIVPDLSSLSSLTIFAVPNSYLSTASDLTHRLSGTSLADVLRYHVVLEYLSWSDLAQIPSSGKLVATLFQTTGRAASDFGSVNITRDPSSGVISVRSVVPYSGSNATVLHLIKNLPYNVSIFAVDSLLLPHGIDLTEFNTQPPLGLNITQALIDGHNFNVAASMLSASGVVGDFEADEGGAGITLFVPTDSAFADLPTNVKLQSLPAEKKAVVLKFHVLHSYYPLGSLEWIVNPVQPTLATEEMGAGSFTLNISRVNGSVGINTGVVLAAITQTVFDENPVSIFGVSEVLLPREIFGKTPMATASKPSSDIKNDAFSPMISPASNGPEWRFSSPPRFNEGIRSAAAMGSQRTLIHSLSLSYLFIFVLHGELKMLFL